MSNSLSSSPFHHTDPFPVVYFICGSQVQLYQSFRRNVSESRKRQASLVQRTDALGPGSRGMSQWGIGKQRGDRYAWGQAIAGMSRRQGYSLKVPEAEPQPTIALCRKQRIIDIPSTLQDCYSLAKRTDRSLRDQEFPCCSWLDRSSS